MGGGTGRLDRGSRDGSRGHTQGAREQRGARQEGHQKKKKRRQTQHQGRTNSGGRAARDEGEAGS